MCYLMYKQIKQPTQNESKFKHFPPWAQSRVYLGQLVVCCKNVSY